VPRGAGVHRKIPPRAFPASVLLEGNMNTRSEFAACALLLAFAAAAVAATPAEQGKAAAKSSAAAKASKAPAKDAPLPEPTPEQQKAAELVYYGDYACEFNQTVNIQANPAHLFYVDVRHGNATWLMKPVLSSTGAMRLEDVKGQMLMVQIASKSMLLDTRSGHRLVDACVSPRQRELMEAAKQAKERGQSADSPALFGGGATAATTPK
jgi:hypothetical protein